MKHIFTLSLCFLALSLSAQDECQGPDFNNDGEIGSSDLIVFLSFYGNEWPIVPEFAACGDQMEHEGYSYSTVQIGEQCWFAENCRYLPEVSPSSEGSEIAPYYYVFVYEGTDVTAAQATTNYATYGAIYNWPAVMTEGICPSGWHIPLDGEFTELTDFLGGESVAGGKMKETGYDHWSYPNTGATNSSGWTGLPVGFRYIDSWATNSGGFWWSASESGSMSWVRSLNLYDDDVGRYDSNRSNGFSARCIKN